MKVNTGDCVIAKGHKFTVAKILELNVYGDDIDLEFLDELGNYHHYQSWHDDGHIEIKEA